MERVASGGETSRFLLALKSVLSEADRTGTLVFDEIDVGVGARHGTVVGDRLRASRKGIGETILWERHEWGKKAHGAGTIEEIPLLWKFSHQRIESLLNSA